MKKVRKTYDAEFRREAVRLASEPGGTARAVERDLGLYQGAISHWKRELAKDPQHAFPGNGRMKPIEEENRRLRGELERTKRERDILKNGLAEQSATSARETPANVFCSVGGVAVCLLVPLFPLKNMVQG